MQRWNRSDKYCWRYRADTILSTDGWTDGQMDRRRGTSIPPFQLRWSREHNNGKMASLYWNSPQYTSSSWLKMSRCQATNIHQANSNIWMKLFCIFFLFLIMKSIENRNSKDIDCKTFIQGSGFIHIWAISKEHSKTCSAHYCFLTKP